MFAPGMKLVTTFGQDNTAPHPPPPLMRPGNQKLKIKRMINNPIRRYVTATYLTFWLMVLIICGGASMVFHAPPLVMRILADVCAWSPTIVLLVMWKRLRPQESIATFLKRCFGGHIVWWWLPLLAIVIAGGVFASAWLLSCIQGRELASYFSMGGWSLGTSLLLSILSGPTGEELGWRGYLREELARRHPFLKAALIQGTVWTFWHTVLWFVDSNFGGWQLLPYAAANFMVMTCLTYMMNVVLERHNNLVYSILMHFAFNFSYCFLQVDIWFYGVLSVVFVTLAVVFGYVFRHADRSV